MHAASRRSTPHAELACPARGHFRCRKALKNDLKGPLDLDAKVDRAASFVDRQERSTASPDDGIFVTSMAEHWARVATTGRSIRSWHLDFHDEHSRQRHHPTCSHRPVPTSVQMRKETPARGQLSISTAMWTAARTNEAVTMTDGTAVTNSSG